MKPIYSLLIVWACSVTVTACSGNDGSSDTTGDAGNTDTETSDDTDTETSTGGTDTGEPGLFSNLEAELHPEFGSIIVVLWEQHIPAMSWIEYSFDDGVWLSSPQTDRAEGQAEEHHQGPWKVVDPVQNAFQEANPPVPRFPRD